MNKNKTEYQSHNGHTIHQSDISNSNLSPTFVELGRLIGPNYEILSTLGEGASGIVYKVKSSFGDIEALKIASPNLFNEEKSRQNFIHELKVARNLRHEHLVPIRNVEVIPENGQVFFTMTYMQGGDLNQKLEWVVRNGDLLQPKKVLGWMYQISQALSYIHQKGLVHQDIKPANILLDDNEQAHLGDFGLAFKYLPQSLKQKMSRTSATGGTSYFMSPEQQQAVFFGKQTEINSASDICSFGLTLYTLLSGRMITGRPISMQTFIRDTRIAAMVDAFLDRCWADNPIDRFKDGTELTRALKLILDQFHDTTIHRDSYVWVPKPKVKNLPIKALSIAVALSAIIWVSFSFKKKTSTGVPPDIPPSGFGEAKEIIDISGSKRDVQSDHTSLVGHQSTLGGTSSQEKLISPVKKTTKKNTHRSNKLLKHELAPGVFLVFKWIPPGSFTMGSPKRFKRRSEKEHSVMISRGFWLMETEMTQDQWTAIIPENPSHFIGANLPVENVSWSDIKTFLKQMENNRFRLPTEAEWEYACRAGKKGEYVGNSEAYAWTIQDSGGTTHLAGKKKPNPWGLHDMYGNVSEWVEDSFSTYPSATLRDPVTLSGRKKVLRGGNWRSISRDCRPASRDWASQDHRSNQIGFRLVREK